MPAPRGATLTPDFFASVAVLTTARAQWAAQLGVGGSAVAVRSVTNVATGDAITLGPADAANGGLVRRRRLGGALGAAAFGRRALGAGAGGGGGDAGIGGGGGGGERGIAEAGAGSEAGAAAGAGAMAVGAGARRLQAAQTTGVRVDLSVNLGASPAANDVAAKAQLVRAVAADPALTAALFAPVAAQLALASGLPARAFVATVSVSSVSVVAPPGPPEPAPPAVSASGSVGLAFGVLFAWALAYVFVWKPLRRGRVTTASLGLEGRAPAFVVAAAARALRAVHAKAAPEGAKVAPGGGQRPSSAEDPSVPAPAPAPRHQLHHHWESELASAAHEDPELVARPAARLAAEAAAGSAAAQGQLGERYLRGVRGVHKDLALAALWLQRAADAGLPRSEALLGALFLRGEAVFVSAEADFDLGLDLVHRAADHGVAAAQHLVDRLHEDGAGELLDGAGAGAERIAAARQRARELTAPAPESPQALALAAARAEAEALPGVPAAPLAAAAAAAAVGGGERPHSSLEEETLAAAERAAWRDEDDSEPSPPRPLGVLSPRRAAWVEPEAPSFGVPTRLTLINGGRGDGSRD